jgi:pimeloyl-ACP methyl ester carboxylesterase
VVTVVAPAGLSHWADDQRRHAYEDAYEASLSLWPVPHERTVVETDYGPTHVVSCGLGGGTPIVLLHAASLSATQWYLQAAALGAGARLHAVDLMADIGLSSQRRALRTRADGAAWLASLLDALSIETAVFVGSSFGGFHATNLAVHYPDRVAGLVLLAPAATILPFKRTANAMIRAGSLLPMPFTVKPGLRSMMQGQLPDARLVRQMEVGVAGFRYDRHSLYPTSFSDAELAAIVCPTLLLVGDKEMIYDPRAAVERARARIPRVEAELMPDVGHLLGMQRPAVVNERIIAYLERLGSVA